MARRDLGRASPPSMSRESARTEANWATWTAYEVTQASQPAKLQVLAQDDIVYIVYPVLARIHLVRLESALSGPESEFSLARFATATRKRDFVSDGSTHPIR